MLLILIATILVGSGVCDMQITDAYIKMGNVCATLEASAQNKDNETAEVAIKAYFYEGADLDKASYIADNSEKVTLAPGSKTEVKVAILYAQGAFTLKDVDIYLDGKLVKTIQDK